MLTLSLPRCLQMMIRRKQVSVKPYIKRPLRKGVSYRPTQLSSRHLFSKKTDVLVRWQMSHAHRRWPTARLSEKCSIHAEFFFEPHANLRCQNLWAVKPQRVTDRAFFFFDCSTPHPHPRTVGLRLMPVWSNHAGAKDDTLWDCAVTLFLRPDPAFSYSRVAVLRAEKVQCVAGLSYWRTLDAAPAARRAEPQRQLEAWGLRVSRPMTEGWYSRATVWDL